MKKQSGFTLIELIVVLAILAIVAAIAVPTAFSSIEKARISACNANEESLQSAWRIESAHASLGGDGTGYTQEELQQILNATVEICDLTDKYNAATQEITDLCPSGGTYTLTTDVATARLEIVCSKHGANAVQKLLNGISDWLAAYSASHPIVASDNNSAAVLKAYQDAVGTETALTDEEIALVFGDKASQINTSLYLRPLPVNINGTYADVQYVSSSTGTTQVDAAFRSYAIIVDGVTYIHMNTNGTISNGWNVNGYGIANLGKGDGKKNVSFATTEDFVTYLTQNGEFVQANG